MSSRDLQFLFTAFVPKCAHVIDKHFDGYSTLQFMEAGRVQLQIAQKQLVMEGPWAWSCYPGPRIRFRCAIPGRTWVHRYLAFRGPLVNRWRKAGLYPIDPQAVADPGAVASKMDDIIALSHRSDRWGHQRAILNLELLLVELAEARSQSSVSAPSAIEASHLKLHINGTVPFNSGVKGTVPFLGINLETLAAEAGISSRTFRRQFKKRLGLSPRAYILSQRINKAKQLLTDTTQPIKHIAAQLGYSDVYFFTRQFKEQTGLPPALYRRSREH